MAKKALITGVTGQDGYYLSRLLLSKGYEVHGWTRGIANSRSTAFIDRLRSEVDAAVPLELHEVDPLCEDSVRVSLKKIQPHEIYNLASQSHVGQSFEAPQQTFAANTLSVLNLLEAIRHHVSQHKIRFFQASSAAIYEGSQQSPQNEETSLAPKSPYGASKASAQLLVSTYRQAYELFVCSGILYNHESPLRPSTFVTGKIVEAVARTALGHNEKLVLGNLETGRDWGYAGDYVEAMWLMLQQDCPQDFVIATGQWHSLKQFLTIAFETVGLDWQDYTESDPKFFRPTEAVRLIGDISKIVSELDWRPTTSFKQMIEAMVKQKIVEMRDTSSRLL